MARTKQAYSFIDLAYDILKDQKKPLTTDEIWELAGDRQKLVQTNATDPKKVLNSMISNNISKDDSVFYVVSSRPAHWGLRELKETYATLAKNKPQMRGKDNDQKGNSKSFEQKKKIKVKMRNWNVRFINCWHPMLETIGSLIPAM